MPRTSISPILLGCICFLPFLSSVQAETISDPDLEFTLELSEEFQQRPDLVNASPDIAHAFEFGAATEDEIAVILLIQKMGGTIRQKRTEMKHMPEGFQGKLFTTEWHGFQVNAFEVPETVNGVKTITYNVQIPLKDEAIQVMLFGRADDTETLKPLLRQILDGLEGESNWSSSTIPSTLAFSENYGTVLLSVAIGGIVLGVVALWFISHRTPKGTVLVIAIVVYVASWQFEDVPVREVRLLTGVMRMFGFAGAILGLIDLFRKRKPKESIEAESSSREDHSNEPQAGS